MGKYNGKRLLLLGTSVGSIEMVKYAKSEGAYVIVTDYLSEDSSEAKKVADESALISTVDIEMICDFCKNNDIDGVFCGVSEINLLNVQKITEKLGLPCYFNMEQWNSLENKSDFFEQCAKYNIRAAKRYKLEEMHEKDDVYPVIVKPVDQSAAIGISICFNYDELCIAYKEAINTSFSGRVIIEKYLSGTEFSAVYTIINGEIKLSMIGDKYLCNKQENRLPLPELYVYPSKYIDRYMNNVNDSVIELISSLNIETGRVIIQGVYDGSEHYVFEAGLRLEGTAIYRFVQKVNGLNMLNNLIDYSLLGKVDSDINLENPYLKGKHCCIVSLLNKGGRIESISGFEDAKNLECVIYTEMRYKEGDIVPNDGTLRQTHIRFFVVTDTLDELIQAIENVRKLVHVRDKNGEEMIMYSCKAKQLMM